MNRTTISTFAFSTLFALALVLDQADAMTITEDNMMKKEDVSMSSTSDAMMKKDETMTSSTSDSMIEVDDSLMKKDMGTMIPVAVDLSIGSRGEDVVSLQTFLVGKSLLIIPTGVSMGYFGPLTKAALMSYQASVGVPNTGYYGPLTRAAMSASMMMKTEDATMPSTSDTMMKKDDVMSSTTDSMMKKDETMMKKSPQ